MCSHTNLLTCRKFLQKLAKRSRILLQTRDFIRVCRIDTWSRQIQCRCHEARLFQQSNWFIPTPCPKTSPMDKNKSVRFDQVVTRICPLKFLCKKTLSAVGRFRRWIFLHKLKWKKKQQLMVGMPFTLGPWATPTSKTCDLLLSRGLRWKWN